MQDSTLFPQKKSLHFRHTAIGGLQLSQGRLCMDQIPQDLSLSGKHGKTCLSNLHESNFPSNCTVKSQSNPNLLGATYNVGGLS